MTDKNSPADAELIERTKQISLLVMDVDGVLTDGKLHYGADGELFKSFSIKDGLGIKLLQKAGIKTAVITGRAAAATQHRCKELGISYIIQGREDKRIALLELCEQQKIPVEHTAYIGDDWPDIGAITIAGLGASVADAHQEVKNRAQWVSKTAGGHGAVRELADFILTGREQLSALLADYLDDADKK